MTNVEQGELAVIVRPQHLENLGKVVEVVQALGHMERGQRFHDPLGRPSVASIGDFMWWVKGKSIKNSVGQNTYVHAADSQLKAIRDPGDDAVDETLLWLPTPSIPQKEEV